MIKIKVLSDDCSVCLDRRKIYFRGGITGVMREQCWLLLELLIEKKEKNDGIASYSAISNKLWGTDKNPPVRFADQGIKDAIGPLKKALAVGTNSDLIENVPKKGYRLINDVRTITIETSASVQDLLDIGYSYESIAEKVLINDEILYQGVPAEYEGSPKTWAKYIQNCPEFWRFIVDDDGEIQGNFSFIAVNDKDARLLAGGKLDDDSLEDSPMLNLYQSGDYIGYLLNLSVNAKYEMDDIYNVLWKELCKALVNAAEQSNVYFKKIYYKAFNPTYANKVTGHGFRHLRKDSKFGDIFVQDMDTDTIKEFCKTDAYGKTLSRLYKNHFTNNAFDISAGNIVNIEQYEASQAYFRLWKRMSTLFMQQNYYQYRPFFFESAELTEKNSDVLFFNRGIVIGWWIRNILQYMEALLPYIPKEQRRTHDYYKEKLNDSFFVMESKNYYEYTTEKRPKATNDEYIPSAKSLISFTNIWLAIDEIFMKDAAVPFLNVFFKPNAELPEKKSDLEICEALAVRIMTALKCAEEHLENIPMDFVNSYADYKEMLRTTSIMWYVSTKYPFLKEELGWSFSDRPDKSWEEIIKDYY